MKKNVVLFGLLAFAGGALAQSIGIEGGRVLAVDREAKVLVLTDRSVWSLDGVSGESPGELKAGDRVQFSYKTPDEGLRTVIEMQITLDASESGSTEVAEGTVLAFDRSAQLLILEDKSAWPVDNLEPAPPPALGAGDRVRIEYRSANDGSIVVEDLIVTFR